MYIWYIMRKNIDLPVEVIKILEHEAVDSKSKFKNLVESMLTTIATHSKYNVSGSDFGSSEDVMNILKSIIQKKSQ